MGQQNRDDLDGPVIWLMKSMSAATGGRAEAVTKAQDELVDSYQKVVDRWCQRRHEDIAALRDLANDVTGARSPAELSTAVLRWYQGALPRLSQDAHDHLELGLTVMHYCRDINGARAFGLGSEDSGRAGQKAEPQAERAKERALHS
jgi:hypothetical protein